MTTPLSRIFYLIGTVLLFAYVLILVVWFMYLVRRLFTSNKILSGRKRHENSSQYNLSVYNAKTHVIKHRYLLAIIAIEILSILLIDSNYLLFAKSEHIWSLGVKILNSPNITYKNNSNLTNFCEIDPRVFAIYHYPYILLIQALTHLLILLLLTMLSIQTNYLEMRYRFSSHFRTSVKLLVSLSVQATVLVLTCFSRFTVLLEPLLFLFFFSIDLVLYISYFHRLKLVIKGRLFEISTFEDYSEKFVHDKRVFRRFVILTCLFCFGLIYPSVFFSFEFYIQYFIIPVPKLCTFGLFFRKDDFVNYVAINETKIHWYIELIKFIPPFVAIPFALVILPHVAFVIYWLSDKAKRRQKSSIFSTDPMITQSLI